MLADLPLPCSDSRLGRMQGDTRLRLSAFRREDPVIMSTAAVNLAMALPGPARVQEVFRNHQETIFRRTDRMFAWLFVFQWIAAIATSLWISPLTWIGAQSQISCTFGLR